MTESEQGFESSTNKPESLSNLRQQIGNLQAILTAALMAMLLLSAGVIIYLYRQVTLVKTELEAATRIVQDYDTNKKQLVNTFVSHLVIYARTHPDFNPVLQRYGLLPGPPPQTPQSTLAPALQPKK